MPARTYSGGEIASSRSSPGARAPRRWYLPAVERLRRGQDVVQLDDTRWHEVVERHGLPPGPLV
jgi:hypothetical protein